MFSSGLLISSLLLILLLAGCAQPPESCPIRVPEDLSAVAASARDDQLPFRFPLDDRQTFLSWAPLMTDFAVSSVGESRKEHHATEDLRSPAGTPVYANADCCRQRRKTDAAVLDRIYDAGRRIAILPRWLENEPCPLRPVSAAADSRVHHAPPCCRKAAWVILTLYRWPAL